MHGIKREKLSEAAARAKKQAELERIASYQALSSRIAEKRVAGERDQEAMDLTRQLLQTNPEYYTIWNFRRETLLQLLEGASEEDRGKVLLAELKFNVDCIKMAPKSYYVWWHRVWTVNQMLKAPWEHELELCAMMLNLDKRNFHCWDYRRFVRSNLPDSDQSEFDYTYKKICQNFSNYSAFHLRTTLLPRVKARKESEGQTADLNGEFDLVKNAIFTEPADQSPWFYHRWLLGESAAPNTLIGAYSTSTEVFVVFSRAFSLQPGSITLHGVTEQPTWSPSHGRAEAPSNVWFATASASQLTVSSSSGAGEYSDVSISPVGSPSSVVSVPAPLPSWYSELLEAELATVQDLCDLEPESKWPSLTALQLKHALRRPFADFEPHFALLTKVDTLRQGYYADLKSAYLCESLTSSLTLSSASALFKGQGLSSVGSLERLAGLDTVDLSHNSLKRVDQAHLLFAAHTLDVSHNALTSLSGLGGMRNLRTLNASHNNISTISALHALSTRNSSMLAIDLRGNPVCALPDYTSSVRALFPSLCELDGAPLS